MIRCMLCCVLYGDLFGTLTTSHKKFEVTGLCGICGGLSGTGPMFYPITPVSPCQHHATNAPHSHWSTYSQQLTVLSVEYFCVTLLWPLTQGHSFTFVIQFWNVVVKSRTSSGCICSWILSVHSVSCSVDRNTETHLRSSEYSKHHTYCSDPACVSRDIRLLSRINTSSEQSWCSSVVHSYDLHQNKAKWRRSL
jgi:hypothetical protein